MFKKFIDLDAWKEARTLVNIVYKVTKNNFFYKDYGLKDQTQRAAVSIMSNIAEGVASKSHLEFIRFLTIARRSANEAHSLLFVALDQNYINKNQFNKLTDQIDKISQIINGFIRYLINKHNGITIKRNND